jgi:hypothetical protein
MKLAISRRGQSQAHSFKPVLTAYAEVEIVVGHYRGPIWAARRSCAGAIDRATERLNDAARRFTPGGLFLAVCWMTDLSCHRC